MLSCENDACLSDAKAVAISALIPNAIRQSEVS